MSNSRRVIRNDLCALCTRHEPTLLPRRLDRVSTAHAVRTLIGGVERIGHAPCRLRRFGLSQNQPLRRYCNYCNRFIRATGCNELHRSRLPCRHHMRSRRRHVGWVRLDRRRRLHRRLHRETAIPGGRANLRIDALRLVSDGAARSYMHHLHDFASRSPGSSRDSQRLAPIRIGRPVILKASEDAIFVVHTPSRAEWVASILCAPSERRALNRRCAAIQDCRRSRKSETPSSCWKGVQQFRC